MSENAKRVQRAAQALGRYGEDHDLAEAAIDLLADLRHWCHEAGLSFDEVNRMAEMHFDSEISEAALDNGQASA